MVKMMKYCLAFGLLLAFAAPAFAQNDYPVFQLAPGYGNLGNKNLVGPGRHSGFVLDTDFNLNSKLGIELFTGYYNLGTNQTLYTNTFGGIFALRKNEHIVPFGVAGFGFGSIQVATQFGIIQGRSMAVRYGGGVDVPFHDSMALRFSATRMGFHFGNAWETGTNYSVGIVLNLSQ
ncbi:MAG TPA: outer membrane beta-barrel protein [Terriglobia bacterium]|nr:outer membrane beta-barrel protein [Terriglobia bacterium]